MGDNDVWYLARGEESHGPLSWTDLANLVKGGSLVPSSLLWTPGFEGWRSAANVSGLFTPPPLPERHDAQPPTLPSSDDGAAKVKIEPSYADFYEAPRPKMRLPGPVVVFNGILGLNILRGGAQVITNIQVQNAATGVAKGLIIFEAALILLVLVLWPAIVLKQCFERSARFPTNATTLVWIAPLVMWLENVIVMQAYPATFNLGSLVPALILVPVFAGLWTAYFICSSRVKTTFTEI